VVVFDVGFELLLDEDVLFFEDEEELFFLELELAVFRFLSTSLKLSYSINSSTLLLINSLLSLVSLSNVLNSLELEDYDIVILSITDSNNINRFIFNSLIILIVINFKSID
jgi:hypothetical protein